MECAQSRRGDIRASRHVECHGVGECRGGVCGGGGAGVFLVGVRGEEDEEDGDGDGDGGAVGEV